MTASSKILSFNSLSKGAMEVNSIKRIDKIEFINLIEENKISLYRLAKSIVKREQDIQDAVNETILKAYGNLGKLKNKDSFKPWIMKILVNECYGILNKQKKIKLEEDMTVYNLYHEDNHGYELMSEIQKLEKDFRTVLVLFYYEDMSIKSISEILNISQGTVKSRLSRAKAKLKIILENSEGGM